MVEHELELADLERQNLAKKFEKLKADASGIIICVRQLKGLLNHIDKRSLELDLKDKELQSLSLDLDKKIETFEAEKSKAGDLTKLVEECTEDLRSKRNQLTARLDSSIKVQRELELRNKQLGQVMAELKRRSDEARKVEEHKREMKEETARKKEELSLIVAQIAESGKQLEKRSREVDLKEKDIEEKAKELDLVKSQVKSWKKKLIWLRKLVSDDSAAELSSREDQVDSCNNTHVEIELEKKQLEQMKTVLVKHSGVVEEENLGIGVTSPVNVVMSSSDILMSCPSMSSGILHSSTHTRGKKRSKTLEETEEKLTLKGEITS